MKYKEHKHCVRLVKLDEHDGLKWGDTELITLMIDTVTGELFLRFCTTEHDIRPGSVRIFDSEITWEEMAGRLTPEQAEKLRGLSKDNWEEWLLENGYV